MKALILAAGYGTRLAPYTDTLPKPLFTLNSVSMLAHAVNTLERADCDQILINTHHLPDQIKEAVSDLKYFADIQVLYEPQILDTGGAIANAAGYLKDAPFFVINADVISNIDLKNVYRYHLKNKPLATLVLHDFPAFNKVGVSDDGFITSFNQQKKALAFTGIQVLSPEILQYLPDKKIFSSIDLYQSLCPARKIKAFIAKDLFWSDIGTPQSYTRTSMQMLAAHVFNIPDSKIKDIDICLLDGDGSDRTWYRISCDNRTAVASAHGICLESSDVDRQLNAFVRIGRHLHAHDVPVPKILAHDRISGIVLLEDLGDTHLADIVNQSLDKRDADAVTGLYEKVIDGLIRFSRDGIRKFDPSWTCQTPVYDQPMILEYECRYFIEAFINGYLEMNVSFKDLEPDFEYIADMAVRFAYPGLMHRDCQSKNIMVRDGSIFFIDFQSARKGPLQYDLASLLIDPYVNLDQKLLSSLVDYTINKLNLTRDQHEIFKKGYAYCCLTRNLQFLGAFAFLTRIKHKKQFEQYIPDAVTSLKQILQRIGTNRIQRLADLVDRI